MKNLSPLMSDEIMMAERSERNLDVVNLEDRVLDLPADVYGQL